MESIMKNTLRSLLLSQAFGAIELLNQENNPEKINDKTWNDAILYLNHLHEVYEDYAMVLREEYQDTLEVLLEAEAISLALKDNVVSAWINVTKVFDINLTQDLEELHIGDFPRIAPLIKQWGKNDAINAWVANKRNADPAAKYQTYWFKGALEYLKV
jgi:hypothetical protein